MMLCSIARRKRNDEIPGCLTVFGRLEAAERGVERVSQSAATSVSFKHSRVGHKKQCVSVKCVFVFVVSFAEKLDRSRWSDGPG
jgi:hypothetical protein